MSELNHPTEINRDYIRLIQGMSRFIKEEFSIAIRMTQEDAVEQLLHYASLSSNRGLLEMAKELKEFTLGDDAPALEGNEEQASHPGMRYYRGAPVASADRPQHAQENPAPATEMKKRPTRVYRGQVVYG